MQKHPLSRDNYTVELLMDRLTFLFLFYFFILNTQYLLCKVFSAFFWIAAVTCYSNSSLHSVPPKQLWNLHALKLLQGYRGVTGNNASCMKRKLA